MTDERAAGGDLLLVLHIPSEDISRAMFGHSYWHRRTMGGTLTTNTFKRKDGSLWELTLEFVAKGQHRVVSGTWTQQERERFLNCARHLVSVKDISSLHEYKNRLYPQAVSFLSRCSNHSSTLMVQCTTEDFVCLSGKQIANTDLVHMKPVHCLHPSMEEYQHLCPAFLKFRHAAALELLTPHLIPDLALVVYSYVFQHRKVA